MRCLAPMLLTVTMAIAPVARAQDDHVYTSDLVTRWGKGVTPDNAWQSYPRPQLQRQQWRN